MSVLGFLLDFIYFKYLNCNKINRPLLAMRQFFNYYYYFQFFHKIRTTWRESRVSNYITKETGFIYFMFFIKC